MISTNILTGAVIAMMAIATVVGAWYAFRFAIDRRMRDIATSLMDHPGPRRPCYRCAAVATKDFMGLYYCQMCREMVSRIYPAALHDPPFGFPGSRGYLEFPQKEEKSA